MYFTNGIFAIANAKGSVGDWARGFEPSLFYRDGHGQGIAPHTKEVKKFENEVWTAGKVELGITKTYDSPVLVQWLKADPANNSQVGARKPLWLGKVVHYRKGLLEARRDKENILSSSFWYYIYSNDNLSRGMLESLLQTTEPGEVMRTLPEKHRAGIDYLYARMGFVNKHPGCLWWFSFWDDLWEVNKGMKIMQNELAKKSLDPGESESVGYCVMKREDLEAWLKERDLFGGTGEGKVCVKVVDALYGIMDEVNKLAVEGKWSGVSGGAGLGTVATGAFNAQVEPITAV